MKLSIIDIGTQSVKHYIFAIEGTEKSTIFYKRYSDAHLGDNDAITPDGVIRTLGVLGECIQQNKSKGVERLKLLGTDILRKAKNAGDFQTQVKRLTGQTIQVISQELEAAYLYQGFLPIVPADFHFAALNIGGGSTEIVIGDRKRMEKSTNVPFGVKFLRAEFAQGDTIDWVGIDAYLDDAITMKGKVEKVFVTGALDFISTAGLALGVQFNKMTLLHHPVSLGIDEYQAYLNTLRATPVNDLKKLYPQDPGFCDNLAIGQSVYLAIAKKLSARTVIPSRNDLTDGVICQMLSKA